MPDEQVASFDTIPLASQVALVRWALAHRGALAPDHEATVRAYRARDLDRLRALGLDAAHGDPAMRRHVAALMRHLVGDRSALMAHRLFLPLREKRVFVSVGALHLDGPEGPGRAAARAGLSRAAPAPPPRSRGAPMLE